MSFTEKDCDLPSSRRIEHKFQDAKTLFQIFGVLNSGYRTIEIEREILSRPLPIEKFSGYPPDRSDTVIVERLYYYSQSCSQRELHSIHALEFQEDFHSHSGIHIYNHHCTLMGQEDSGFTRDFEHGEDFDSVANSYKPIAIICAEATSD